ncbi:unnamed protein product [Symbiodinium microadriaticum]|nr:unnamed protein product [Symbiodinium microadriaticum]
MLSRLLSIVAAVSLFACASAGARTTGQGEATPGPSIDQFNVETIADGLNYPWSIAFLPDGDLLITERNGGIRHVKDGKLLDQAVVGGPSDDTVVARSQGGLFDIVLAPDFAISREVYLAYAGGTRKANGTTLMRAKFIDGALQDAQVIFTVSPLKDTGAHFGGRIAFMADGSLLLALGDGHKYREKSQELDSHIGTVVRLNRDGSPAAGNPFTGQAGALPEIYSYGHRNIQGLAIDPVTGVIWSHEHGARGGDEVNPITPGKNYGWPIATTGIDYTGARISPYQSYPGTEDPVLDWVPSIAPSGLAVVRSPLFPDWAGDLLVGGLASADVRRLDVKDGKIIGEEILFAELDSRIRDVRIGPDGAIWLLLDDEDGKESGAMDGITLGGGLAAMGFWLFIGLCVIGGIWEKNRKRESQQETIRKAMDKGLQLTPETIDHLIGEDKDIAKDLKVSGIIVMAISPGLVVMGIALAFITLKALAPLFGAAAITAFIGAGLWYAGQWVQREDERLAAADEALIVRLAQTGDRDAFTELVRRREQWLRLLMRRLCGNASLADDLAQDALLQAWKHLGKLKQADRFPGWLKQIAINGWRQTLRKKDILAEAGDDLDDGQVDAAPTGLRIDLDRALALLKPDVRLCIVLNYHEGMSHGEIATMTGLAEGTIKSHIRRGAEILRQQLDLARLFADAPQDVATKDFADFADRLDRRIDRSLRQRRFRQIALGVFFTALIWGLGIVFDNPASFVTDGLMVPLFDLPDDRLTAVLGPANSVGGLITLGLLGFAMMLRRIFVK